MQFSRNKTKAITIATFLVLTVTASLLALPLANAHTPPQHIPTWTYVGVTPDIIGVNQQVEIVFWQNFIPPTADGNYGDRWFFYVDVMKPDGTNDTFGPIKSDPVGGSWMLYIPTQLGNYTIVARFIAKTLDNTPNGINPSGLYSGSSMGNMSNWLGDIFDASTSAPDTLVVQQEQLQHYQETPLPTGYWTRPVYGNNEYWGKVMGQWLNTGDTPGRVNAYSAGPESAHIQWSRPYWTGGVMGGGGNVNFGNIGYYTGSVYEGFGGPSLILAGKLYYSVSGGRPPTYGWYCVDLYTGKTLYYENNTDGHSAMPSMGEVLDMEYVNQHGGMSYLWRTSGVTIPNPGGVNGTVWEMLDAFTGKSIAKIANVSNTGTQFVDDIGSICYLNIVNIGTSANPNYRMTCWNTTQTMWYNPIYYTTSATNLYWEWRPYSTPTSNPAMPFPYVYNGAKGYSLNVSCPAVQGTIRAVVRDEYVIGGTTGNITTNPGQNTAGNLWAISLEPGKEGTLLWNFTFTPPPGLGDAAIQSIQFSTHDTVFGGVDAADGIFYFTNTMNRVRWIYSLNESATGQPQGTLLWTGAPESQWQFYGMSTGFYQGKLFSYGGYSGILIAYNATTGQIMWNWSAPYVGVDETTWEHTPLSVGCIADGKLYLYSTEHSVNSPIRRDSKIYCVDATTGKLIWSIPCYPSSAPIIADGRIIVLDSIDNMIYCYGPGNSKTTVSAPQTDPSLGSSVTITGTVTDDTPTGRLNINAGGTSIFGSTDTQPATGDYDFVLKGTPAISDADQEAWMTYLFQQRPLPSNAKGVEVSLDAIDPNNNFIHIGTTTSDLTGAYGINWKPDVPGTYQIIAKFAGSRAYSSSFAQTYMTVGEAPATVTQPEIPQPIDNTMTIVAVGIAMIIAVAVATLLILRKR